MHDKDHDLFVQLIQRYRRRGMPIGEPRFVGSELFAVSADPREVVELSAARPELASEFQARVEKQMLNQRLPEYALDEAREMEAFVSPSPALFEGTIESDGPLELSSPLPGCDPWLAQRRDDNTIEFRCGAPRPRWVDVLPPSPGRASLQHPLRRRAARAPRLLPGCRRPSVAGAGDGARARSGRFVYRQLRPAGADEDVGQGELNRAFAAWGYRQ